VVAADQASARHYLDIVRVWMPTAQAERDVQLATSSVQDAHASLAAFRLFPEPAVLVTVAMAYEGLDAPEVVVVAALTQVRSRPWLEQMLARAARVDPHAGSYAEQRALVFHPDDPLFARFRAELDGEQGTTTRPHQSAPVSAQTPETIHWRDTDPGGITPLESNALGMCYAMLWLSPKHTSTAVCYESPASQALGSAASPVPSLSERTLRQQLAAAIVGQVVEDEADLRAPRSGNLAHRHNAVLKRIFG